MDRAACGLADVYPELVEKCYQATKSLALKGDSDALFSLKASWQDPAADDLLKTFPHTTVLAEIALIAWRERPTLESLEMLVKAHELGSLAAPVYIIADPFDESLRADRDALIDKLPPRVKAQLRAALQSLLQGEHHGRFGG